MTDNDGFPKLGEMPMDELARFAGLTKAELIKRVMLLDRDQLRLAIDDPDRTEEVICRMLFKGRLQ